MPLRDSNEHRPAGQLVNASGKIALRRFKKSRSEPRPAVLTGLILVAFYILLYFAVPAELRDRMPVFLQRVVSIAAAVLAMLAVLFALRDWGFYRSVRIAGLGRVKWATIVGAIVFVAVLSWWLSPWAPLKSASAAVMSHPTMALLYAGVTT